MKNKTPLIVAAALGILAVIMVYSYINRVKTSVTRGMEPVNVVVAAKPIARGDTLDRSKLAFRALPKKYVGDRAISSDEELDLIIGRPVRFNLQKGQPVFWSDVGEEGKGGLSSMIGAGERAVTISVDEITGVGALIQPNDHVDIMGTFDTTNYGSTAKRGTPNPADMKAMQEIMQESMQNVNTETATITLLQNVTVLATGKAMTPSLASIPGITREEASYSNVTLLVTPQEAEMLVFAQQKGKLSLLLRKPDDLGVIEDFPKMTDQEIMNQIWPKKLSKERKDRIEVIRGKDKSVE